jgi:hypothetical protein
MLFHLERKQFSFHPLTYTICLAVSMARNSFSRFFCYWVFSGLIKFLFYVSPLFRVFSQGGKLKKECFLTVARREIKRPGRTTLFNLSFSFNFPSSFPLSLNFFLLCSSCSFLYRHHTSRDDDRSK